MIGFECTCAQGKHYAPAEGYEISEGAINKLPEILKDYNRIYVVADKNTYKVAGGAVEKILSDAGKLSHLYVLTDDIILPDPKTIGNILIHLHDPDAKSDIFQYSPKPDFILAVGSGTINDSCRVVSYRVGIPYGVFGTAPSMDGYLSAGSPTLHDGTKTTIQGTTPKYFITDLDISKNAPYDMLLSGIGDMFGKYTGLADWELARDVTGEYFCDRIANDVLDATNKCLENGYNIEKREPECIKNIMEGFLVTGLGMAYTGNSRPASGSEHIIAHAWELFDVERGHAPNLHGLEVCQATRIVAFMYQMLVKETDDERVIKIVEKYNPYFEAVEEFCVKMNVPPTVKTREGILEGIQRALPLRDRYTILFYLRDMGKFEEYAERATDMLLERL